MADQKKPFTLPPLTAAQVAEIIAAGRDVTLTRRREPLREALSYFLLVTFTPK